MAELYNRQLYVMGREAQSALGAADVLIVGARGVGGEIGALARALCSPRIPPGCLTRRRGVRPSEIALLDGCAVRDSCGRLASDPG
jgi:hypothetical protein